MCRQKTCGSSSRRWRCRAGSPAARLRSGNQSWWPSRRRSAAWRRGTTLRLAPLWRGCPAPPRRQRSASPCRRSCFQKVPLGPAQPPDRRRSMRRRTCSPSTTRNRCPRSKPSAWQGRRVAEWAACCRPWPRDWKATTCRWAHRAVDNPQCCPSNPCRVPTRGSTCPFCRPAGSPECTIRRGWCRCGNRPSSRDQNCTGCCSPHPARPRR